MEPVASAFKDCSGFTTCLQLTVTYCVSHRCSQLVYHSFWSLCLAEGDLTEASEIYIVELLTYMYPFFFESWRSGQSSNSMPVFL